MNTTLWNCETCNKSMNRTSKSRHLKSQAHLAKSSGLSSVPATKDCDVCYEPQLTKKFKKCTQCVNSWCGTCHQKMDKCPFCRVEIEGAERRPYVWNPTPEEFPMFYVDFNPENIDEITRFYAIPEPIDIEPADEISRFYADFNPEPANIESPEPLHVRQPNEDFIQWVMNAEYNEDFDRQLDEMIDYFTPVNPYAWRMDPIF